MNILFLMYHNYKSNSAIQVHQFANILTINGHCCAICVPDDKETINTIKDKVLYNNITYKESLNNDLIFFKGNAPDIIHVWTPREIVRKQTILLKERFPNSKIVIHLEDNEEFILEKTLGQSYKSLQNLSENELNAIIPEFLAHPKKYKKFLLQSDGVTYIMDKLERFVPSQKESLMLWPVINYDFFSQKNSNELLKKYKLTKNEIIITYTGNVHHANYKEVRSLYLAVVIANREGIPCRLIRTGNDYVDFLGADTTWAHKYSVELGFVNYDEIPSLLNAANLLIQPGKADEFNDYRLPSKIPEFLATAVPVIIPNANIAGYLKNDVNSIIMKEGNSVEIFEIIKKYKQDPQFFQQIGKRGKAFCIENFNAEKIYLALINFYSGLLNAN